METTYDAVVVVSFGGPEGPDEVIPFLENVLRGRDVPRSRLEEVAGHYAHFGGVSPINAANRALVAALAAELAAHAIALPVYWGNRNWHPLLPDTLARMGADGVRRALAFVTSAYSSWSGCRQYREDFARARAEVGAGAPEVEKLRAFYNHPGFVEANAAHVAGALGSIPPGRREGATLLFTAHSIPLAMAAGCAYEGQLAETCRLVAEAVGHPRWRLVYQSRSGAPGQPWLGPDVREALEDLALGRATDVVVSPVGFISDHMEVRFDLDTEAGERAAELGLNMVRAATAGSHPAFVGMVRELVEERLGRLPLRRAIGRFGPGHDVCPADCCLPGSVTSARPGSS